MASAIDIPAEKKQQAHDYFINHPTVSLQDIATFLGVSLSTFKRLRRRWNWPSREDVVAAPRPAPEEVPSSLREAALALAQVARSHIDALVKEQRTRRTVDHDKCARALASYAKTLTTAQALLEQEGSTLDDSEHHDDAPRTIHDLRDELARHLERIVAEEEARGSDGLLV
jgi:hypothetical protein